MKRMAAAGLMICMLAACGDEVRIEPHDLAVEVVLGATEVETGRGFPVTVVRTWARSLEPSPWDDGVLSPLVLRDRRVSRREDAGHVQETLHFRAHAFTLKDVTIPPVAFVGRPRDGGTPKIATSGALRLGVRPTLDRAHPGPPEGPGPRPESPGTGWVWYVALAALLGALAVGARRRRRAPVETAPEVADADLTLLASLRGRSGGGAAARAAAVLAAADVVRRRAGARCGLPGRCRTTHELHAALLDDGDARAALDAVLGRADLVKFAAATATPAVCADVLAAAETFVRRHAGGTP